MSCCGHRRAMMHGAAPARGMAATSSGPLSRSTAAPPVTFEYQGENGVSAVGGVTRTLYRFTGRQARVAVDARDAASLSALPGLRRVG